MPVFPGTIPIPEETQPNRIQLLPPRKSYLVGKTGNLVLEPRAYTRVEKLMSNEVGKG